MAGQAKVKFTVDDASHGDVEVTIFGEDLKCSKELYKMDGSKIDLPNITKPDDCVGQKLKQFGASPSDLKLTYDAKKDTVCSLFYFVVAV